MSMGDAALKGTPKGGRQMRDLRSESRQDRSTRRLAGLAVAVVLAGFLNGCKEDTRAEPEIVRPVKVVVVGEPAQGRSLTYSGVVRPRIESAIGFRVAGKIVQRLVNVGDRVEVDQVIARLDEIDLRLVQNG